MVSEPALNLYLEELEKRLLTLDERGHNYSNLSSSERTAITDLKNYGDVVIKQADKGSAVVVLDLSDYCKEAFRQLNDVSIYEPVSSDPTCDLTSLIQDKLSSLHNSNYIDANCFEYLAVDNPKLGKFYLLPKIHKSLTKGEIPGRPIVSNCGMPTERISEFLDFHLQPLVQGITSYIKDTTHFLSKLNDVGILPDNALLVSIDVVGLYSHIPHSEGLQALSKFLDTRDNACIPTSALVDLARIVLENNYFEFNGSIFHQKQGTAMGTKFAPAFANIFMGEFEDRFLNTSVSKPELWWRFLDDVFMIWNHGRPLLDEFLNSLNSFHPTIKFTFSISDKCLCFLDVLVGVENGNIFTDLYCKPTDAHQYLDSKSCHPSFTKRAIPYSQALRIKRICSSESNFEKRTGEMKSWFLKKGYKGNFINLQIDKARRKSRGEVLRRRPLERVDREFKVPLVLDFHPSLSKVSSILTELQPILSSCSNTARVFSHNPFVSFRRPRNLKDHLVRAKLPSSRDNSNPVGMHTCGKTRCQICKFVSCGRTFSDFNGEQTFFINHYFNCDSAGVVYLLSCMRCKMQYIGSTITPFRKRFNNHKSSINRYGRGQRDLPGEHLYAHFFSEGHQGLSDLSAKIIDKTNINEPTTREGFWAYKLDSFIPRGLNLRDFF